MKNCLLIVSIILLSFTNSAQTDFAPTGSFKVELGLPNIATNNAYRELMQGLVVVTPSYQHTFDNTFSIGGGLRYSYFNVNQFKNNAGISGGMHMTGVFGKIGVEKFYGNFGVDYGIRIGYAMNLSTTNAIQDSIGGPYISDGGFVEPTLGLSLMSTENSSFRLALSYAFHAFIFKPEHIGLEDFSGLNPDKLDALSTYFTIGFGYSYYF
ncbi:MAG: hypothetical protein COA32_03595 [Fluviicola sp.]|nr:MAG: hypothetical protein COA32_03595 [Fluviicola sp.]